MFDVQKSLAPHVNHPGIVELAEFRQRQTEHGLEDGRGVLSYERWQSDGVVDAVDLDGIADQLQGTALSAWQSDDHVARRRVRMLQSFGDGHDLGERQPDGFEALDPLGGGAITENRVD